MKLFENILVPTDFSEEARAALDQAIALAHPLGCTVHLMHACDRYVTALAPGALTRRKQFWSEVREGTRQRLERLAAAVTGAGVASRVYVDEGAAHRAILDRAAKIPAQLIVMGTRGDSGLAHVLLDSGTAERTLRDAHCPVITVRAN